MSSVICDSCGDLIDTDYDIMHSIEFLGDDNDSNEESYWCLDCISQIPEGVRIKLDGISSVYREGMLVVLN